MSPEEDLKARELFIRYEGSRFYMSRDGLEASYLEHRVPKEVEARWLEELTAQRLRELSMSGNWRAVHFLIHQGDYRHVDAVLGAAPRGVLCERCAFLEEFLAYLSNSMERGLVAAAAARSALASVILHSTTSRRRARAEASRHRIERIIQAAESMRDKRTSACT